MAETAKELSYPEYLVRREGSEVRLEYVDGVVYAMTGGTIEHARLAANVIAELRTRLAGSPCAVFSSDLAIRVSETNRTTYADAVVVCGDDEIALDDPHAIVNPAVVVEVLSSSTEAADRGEKFRHYQRLGSLTEYVLVSQGEPRVEVFTRQENAWLLRTYGSGEAFELASRGVTVQVDAVYADPRDR